MTFNDIYYDTINSNRNGGIDRCDNGDYNTTNE